MKYSTCGLLSITEDEESLVLLHSHVTACNVLFVVDIISARLVNIYFRKDPTRITVTWFFIVNINKRLWVIYFTFALAWTYIKDDANTYKLKNVKIINYNYAL